MRWYTNLVRYAVALVAATGLMVGPRAFAASEPVFPPGASVGLVPPPGMSPAAAFAGFQHEAGASIVLVEMPPEAYAQIVAKFTPEALKPTGFMVKGEAQPLAVTGGEGRLFRGSQDANGLSYTKWVAVVRGPAGTALVTVQVPTDAKEQVSDSAVETALKTIAFRAEQSLQEQMAALPFKVGDTAGFRPVRMIGGSGLILTEGPKDVDPEGTQPFVIIAASLGRPVAPDAQAAYAKTALNSLAQLKDIKIENETRSEQGKATVYRHHAAAADAKTGKPVKVTQTVIFQDGSYVRVIGMDPVGKGDVIARADKLAGSVTAR
ncbi:hypothetical protein GCM10007301_33500 [Azorhizobium oxalatiphilum]|uniref:Uncharacterized protein n=1 Tax=Azorhizobium oxalatiphilum TaxID=980631 RepID=A0A917FET4_9HYPH|nr:hypothetical protein [Azorhizobium oxalatiphilum]GGF71060.1 hypothetical protein GCM10007301_33500 [Azorhizobium oxalatiphilum]